MTSADQLLEINVLYTGYVTEIKNAVSSRPYKGIISYVHRVTIRFDKFPDRDIVCSYMNSYQDSNTYSSGEYVRVLIKNFVYNNYGIEKDPKFEISETEKQTIEAAEILYLPGTTPEKEISAGADMFTQMMHSAIMGAATFCQYRNNCSNSDFYNMIEDLFIMQKQQNFKQPQK